MFLYYNENEIYLDFQTIKERVSLPESTLYRKILKSNCKTVMYRNRMLFRYKDILYELPEVYKAIQDYEIFK